MIDPLYSMALMTGLLGSGHCIGMCGGIVAACSLSESGRQGGFLFHLLYNLGRITTYGLIGIAVGAIGSVLAYREGFMDFSRWVLIGSDLFVIVLGLGTAGLFSRLNVMKLEFPGPTSLLTGAIRRLRSLPPALSALPLGLLFGLLPCGFLYAMLMTAAQTAAPLSGALVMIAFGLGTAPSLILFGRAAQWLGTNTRLWMLRGAGLMVALMGCYNLWRHLHMMAS